MLTKCQNSGSLCRAFTLLEVLIVLSILIGVSAVVLPSMLSRGLGDLRSDTQLQIQAALLDAQREARRTGLTVEVLLQSSQEAADSKIVIQPMHQANTQADTALDGSAWEISAPRDEAEAELGTGQIAEDNTENDPESEFSITLAYAMPDGTLVSTTRAPRIELDGEPFELEIDAAAITVSLSPAEDGAERDMTAEAGESEDTSSRPEGGSP